MLIRELYITIHGFILLINYVLADNARLKFDLQNAEKNIPLSQQVRLFESTKAEMEAKVGPRAVGELLGRSFFLVGTGSNDLFAFRTELAKQNRSATQGDVAALYGSLITNYSAAITVC